MGSQRQELPLFGRSLGHTATQGVSPAARALEADPPRQCLGTRPLEQALIWPRQTIMNTDHSEGNDLRSFPVRTPLFWFRIREPVGECRFYNRDIRFRAERLKKQMINIQCSTLNDQVSAAFSLSIVH